MVFSDMHHFIGELAKKLRRGSSVLRISIRFELVAVPDFVVHSLIGYGNELLSDKLSQKVQWAFLMNVPLLRQQKIPMLIGIESFRLAIVILPRRPADRKSTRLNSSHVAISYAVFCLKKKKKYKKHTTRRT